MFSKRVSINLKKLLFLSLFRQRQIHFPNFELHVTPQGVCCQSIHSQADGHSFEELARRNIELAGKTERKNIGKVLSTMFDFKRRSRYVWNQPTWGLQKNLYAYVR